MDTVGDVDTFDVVEEEARRGRLRAMFAGSRTLLRVAWRDPDHLPERLMLAAADRLGPPARVWAEETRARRPNETPATIAAEVRRQSALVARVDGAIAGTPFFIALLPGYLGYLWQEATMVLRTAALYGRDPTSLRTTAEVLALRGIHPTVDAAEESLRAVQATPLPAKPAERRPLKLWITSVRMMLVVGGFLEAPDPAARSRSRVAAVLSILAAGVLWAITWVLPVTFMVAMAWGCEHDTRKLGWRALLFYSGDASDTAAAIRGAGRRRDSGHDARQLVRSAVLLLSVVIPIGFVAYADHVRNTTGIGWVGALGAVVALSIVIAFGVYARSR